MGGLNFNLCLLSSPRIKSVTIKNRRQRVVVLVHSELVSALKFTVRQSPLKCPGPYYKAISFSEAVVILTLSNTFLMLFTLSAYSRPFTSSFVSQRFQNHQYLQEHFYSLNFKNVNPMYTKISSTSSNVYKNSSEATIFTKPANCGSFDYVMRKFAKIYCTIKGALKITVFGEGDLVRFGVLIDSLSMFVEITIGLERISLSTSNFCSFEAHIRAKISSIRNIWRFRIFVCKTHS